jgi:transcriptional regulator with XRE-family HTH domain
MTTRQRPAATGAARGRRILADLVGEAHNARLDRGLSLRDVGRAVGISQPAMTRFEHQLVEDIGIVRMSRILTVVGLELSARAYPGGQPLRDAGHVRLLSRFRAALHPSLGWATEVPLPATGDPRAWDGVVRGRGWRYGAEAEIHPTDAQALGRRIELKQRDGRVDGVLLVLPDTRHVRLFLAAAADVLLPAFPVPGRRALELLSAGVDPGGNSVIVL